MLKFINLPSTMDVVKHVEKQVEKTTSMLYAKVYVVPCCNIDVVFSTSRRCSGCCSGRCKDMHCGRSGRPVVSARLPLRCGLDVPVRSHKSSKFDTSRVSLLVASHVRTVRPTAVIFSPILVCTLLDVAVFFFLWLLLSTNCFQVRNMLRNAGFPGPHFLQIGTAPLTSNTVCDAQLR
jgi:hypothetical protein